MSGSVVVALKKEVIAGLTTHFAALPDFNGTTAPERHLEVAYGYDKSSQTAERLFTGRSRGDTPPAAMKQGRNHRNETATFDLIVVVEFVGGSAEDAEDRALEIGAEVETWLADRKSGQSWTAAVNSVVVEGWELVNLMNDLGNLAELTYRVRWAARLT